MAELDKFFDFLKKQGGSDLHLSPNARPMIRLHGSMVPLNMEPLSADPNHLKAQYSLAASLEKTGNNARAKREWRRYLDMDSDSEWAQRARARLAELEQ